MSFLYDLQRHTILRKVAATQGGEWAGPCPFCGGRDRFHVQPARERWLCRGCTAGKWQSVGEYYRRRGDPRPEWLSSRTTAPRTRPRPHPAAWRADPWPLLRQYAAHPQRFELWQAHKPLSRDTIERMHLGVGVLPACSCHHERLIVPILDGGLGASSMGAPSMVVGLRGRRLACACPQKWHQSAGTTLDLLPLYNQQALTPGCSIWIVENCVDALLIGERWPAVGLATYSISYWKDAWLEPLLAMRPRQIIVAYDNDLPGNGGAHRREEFIQQYRAGRQPPPDTARGALRPAALRPAAARPARLIPIPEAAGPRLVARLEARGLPAYLYDWGDADLHTDIGTLLQGWL